MIQKIELTQNKVTTVDDDMFAVLNKVKWFLCGGYAKCVIPAGKGKQRHEFMHHYITGFPLNGFQVDHIDGDMLNNRRENLRFVTNRQNQQNKSLHRRGRLVGCYWHKRVNRWRAQIRIDKARKHLGYFDTEHAAHERYTEELQKLNSGGLT